MQAPISKGKGEIQLADEKAERIWRAIVSKAFRGIDWEHKTRKKAIKAIVAVLLEE